jgi:hypothetical protein
LPLIKNLNSSNIPLLIESSELVLGEPELLPCFLIFRVLEKLADRCMRSMDVSSPLAHQLTGSLPIRVQRHAKDRQGFAVEAQTPLLVSSRLRFREKRPPGPAMRSTCQASGWRVHNKRNV